MLRIISFFFFFRMFAVLSFIVVRFYLLSNIFSKT